jgi:ribosomal protein S8
MIVISNYVANYISIINYAIRTKKLYCRILYTKYGERITSLLFRHGYILSYRIINEKNYSFLYIQLKKSNMFNPLLQLKLISKPKNSTYWTAKRLINECLWSNNLTFYVLSTSKGLLLSNNAIEHNVGGKVLFKIN